jgi:transcriptional regulator with GAF, ATPase, and Fis domain
MNAQIARRRPICAPSYERLPTTPMTPAYAPGPEPESVADLRARLERLEARAAKLERLDGLLRTLPGVLDIREVFARVSEIAGVVLPHDAMGLPLITEDREHVRPFATIGLPPGTLPPILPLPDSVRALLATPWEFQIFEDIQRQGPPEHEPMIRAGYRAVLRVPIRFDGQMAGGLIFFSKIPGAYTEADVPFARRIADHVTLALSHQRLAEHARRNEELRARAAHLDLLDQVLMSLTDTGVLPQIWERISIAAQNVLSHDGLFLTAVLPSKTQARVYASHAPAHGRLPDIVAVPPGIIENLDWEFQIFDDLQADPIQRLGDAAKVGYRSALRVPIRLSGEYVAGVSFLSFTPGLYTPADVAVGRRIADRMMVSFARERAAALSKRAEEAAARATKLEQRVQALTEELDARTGFRRVAGESKVWRQVLTQAAQVAATDTTALLLGESGTGKEVVARFIHRASSRSTGPFVALNCAALPEQLLEAELFGYERGAYTGATQSKPGQLEQAGGGTLFLDEVGEMSPAAQAKFLRVLQEREFQRLGGTRVLRTDARVVAATNRDLQRAIATGQFREDLYYRLNVFAIRLPPLRERLDDVLPLSEVFLAEFAQRFGRPPAGISRDARTLLVDYHWPGNVRELHNMLERAAILCEGGLITPDHLAFAALSAPATPAAPERPAATPASAAHLQSMERTMIEDALKKARFNKSKTARALGLTRQQLYVRMRRYGLE